MQCGYAKLLRGFVAGTRGVREASTRMLSAFLLATGLAKSRIRRALDRAVAACPSQRRRSEATPAIGGDLFQMEGPLQTVVGRLCRHLALGLRDGDENRRTPPVCSDNKPRNVADDLKRDAEVAARTKVRIVRGACTVATVQHLTLEVIHGRQLEPAAQA